MSPNIHFAMGGAIFGAFTTEFIQLISKYGLLGAEPYRGGLGARLDKPEALKDILDENNVQLITASNGGPNQSTEFIDPYKREETVADHVDFLAESVVFIGRTIVQFADGVNAAACVSEFVGQACGLTKGGGSIVPVTGLMDVVP